jgi:hypothetical protein
MPNNLNASRFLFISTYSFEDFMVREDVIALNGRGIIRTPSFQKAVVILNLVGGGNRETDTSV